MTLLKKLGEKQTVSPLYPLHFLVNPWESSWHSPTGSAVGPTELPGTQALGASHWSRIYGGEEQARSHLQPGHVLDASELRASDAQEKPGFESCWQSAQPIQKHKYELIPLKRHTGCP